MTGKVHVNAWIKKRASRNEEVADNIWDEFFHKSVMLPNVQAQPQPPEDDVDSSLVFGLPGSSEAEGAVAVG